MSSTFPLFQKLPPEIRLEIWRIALSQSWSFGAFKGGRGRRKFRGIIHHQVTHSCHEARQVSRTSATYLRPLDIFIDFSKLLLEFRQYLFSDISGQAQHVVLNPRDWEALFAMTRSAVIHFRKLRTLVVVGPWFDPKHMFTTNSRDSWLWSPWEDWSPLPLRSPNGIDWRPLFDDVDADAAEYERRHTEYRARVDAAVRDAPSFLPQDLQVFPRTQNAIERLEKMVEEGSWVNGVKPRLYLCTVDQQGKICLT